MEKVTLLDSGGLGQWHYKSQATNGHERVAVRGKFRHQHVNTLPPGQSWIDYFTVLTIVIFPLRHM